MTMGSNPVRLAVPFTFQEWPKLVLWTTSHFLDGPTALSLTITFLSLSNINTIAHGLLIMCLPNHLPWIIQHVIHHWICHIIIHHQSGQLISTYSPTSTSNQPKHYDLVGGKLRHPRNISSPTNHRKHWRKMFETTSYFFFDTSFGSRWGGERPKPYMKPPASK